MFPSGTCFTLRHYVNPGGLQDKSLFCICSSHAESCLARTIPSSPLTTVKIHLDEWLGHLTRVRKVLMSDPQPTTSSP